MQINASSILIFDSGVGALSVFQEIALAEPNIHCTLALDNAHFPYGTMDESRLIERVIEVIGGLATKAKPDLAVIACNTASTLVLEELRKEFDIPFVGVVPAIKPAASLSQSQSIGLLATPATVERSYTDALIEDFAPQCEILRVGSTDLVYMAEQKLRGKTIDLKVLKEIVEPFINHGPLDTLVLACTHFPLLKAELEQVLPERIQMLDSGSAIAQRVISLLQNSSDERSNTENFEKQAHKIYLTSPDCELDSIESYCRELGFEAAEVIVL